MDEFKAPQAVIGRASIADLFRVGKRCGLYILHFENGEFYAGQAVDVTRRYVQHRKVHPDIRAIQFRPVPQRNLNIEERSLIQGLEASGHKLRNIVFASIPKGESDFDLIMPIPEQEQWMHNRDFVTENEPRIIADDLRQRYSAKFQSFKRMPDYARVVTLLRQYIAVALPVPKRSELTFWACSCLPAYSDSQVKLYCRINIYWQEVLTLFRDAQNLWLSIHLASSSLIDIYGSSLGSLRTYYRTLQVSNHKYAPGGQDQIHINVAAKEALEFLLEPGVIAALRLFNLRLMKKGPCSVSRFHCMDLADQILP